MGSCLSRRARGSDDQHCQRMANIIPLGRRQNPNEGRMRQQQEKQTLTLRLDEFERLRKKSEATTPSTLASALPCSAAALADAKSGPVRLESAMQEDDVTGQVAGRLEVAKLVSRCDCVFMLSTMQQAADQSTRFVESSFKAVPIWSLSDDLLPKIFSYLNANDRFRLAEVCTRWAGVSRMDWTDLTRLDLSLVAAENIGPILRLCPKLESISARECKLNVSSITENLRGHLTCLSLHRVAATADVRKFPQYPPGRLVEAVFSELQSLPHLEELVLSELRIGIVRFNNRRTARIYLPAALKRLQLSSAAFCLGLGINFPDAAAAPWNALDGLILDPFIDVGGPKELDRMPSSYAFQLQFLFRLQQLRELCVLPFYGSWGLDRAAFTSLKKLNRLELLCVDAGDASAVSDDFRADLIDLVPIFNSHPSLRIFIITGHIDENHQEALIPPRCHYPNGFCSDPLPFLHIFIGGTIAQKLRFASSPNDAMKVHPITLPMPAFLEQPDVAEIFKGSWIGEMIKKSAKSNTPLWDYDERTAQSYLN